RRGHAAAGAEVRSVGGGALQREAERDHQGGVRAQGFRIGARERIHGAVRGERSMTDAQLDEAGWKARLDAGGRNFGVDLDQSQLDTLWRYAYMLRERNEHVNLTSITSLEGILTLHMLDSLSVLPYLGDAKRVIDVGTGGGFPGVPLAVASPQRQFT